MSLLPVGQILDMGDGEESNTNGMKKGNTSWS